MALGLGTGMTNSIPMPASADIAMQSLKHTTDLKTQQSAKDFEALFLSQMVSHMFEGVDPDPLFGGGSGEKMFRTLLTQEYGRLMAEGNGVGISSQIQTMMLKIQEQQ